MVSVRGEHRRSADVVGELMDVLADEPRVVACDLAGMTAEGSAMLAGGFAPVGEYLTQWPGTVVMVYAPAPRLCSRLYAAMSGERLLIHISRDAAGSEPHELLPRLRRRRLSLWPGPAAPDEARSLVTQTSLDRQLATTGRESRRGRRRGHCGRRPRPDAQPGRRSGPCRLGRQPTAALRTVGGRGPSPLTGSGLRLVQALPCGWGVKTVWIVLDTATGQRNRRYIQQASAAHEARPLRSRQHGSQF
jgi:hypothetical protein